jgi:adenine-specific DNA methylase
MFGAAPLPCPAVCRCFTWNINVCFRRIGPLIAPECMRYLGNKTKLLPFIAGALDRLGVPPGGRALDAFAGTAAVGAFLKSRGAAVVGCDLMTFSFVFQRAYVVADTYPRFSGLLDDPGLRAARQRADFTALVDSRVATRAAASNRASGRHATAGVVRSTRVDAPRARRPVPGVAADSTRPLDEMLVYLDHYLDPLTSFVSSHFAMRHTPIPAAATGDGLARARTGRAGGARLGAAAPSIASPRMYFTLDAARRIDAIRTQLHDWQASAAITDDEYYILLATLLEAADAVANTAGVYAAYIKSWQSNALRSLRLRMPVIAASPRLRRSPRARCEAHLGDVSTLAPKLGRFDLLYLDPPYNTRQYSAYYHVPELIAQGWFGDPPVLRGKTGLLPDAKKSEWSTRAGCVAALDRLLATADADHVVLSYNSEGIIPEAEIKRIFRAYGRPGTYRRLTRTYQRYRSDRPSASRRYTSDSVREHLYCVRLQD